MPRTSTILKAATLAAGLFVVFSAQAMTLQTPRANADGSAKLADPDEAVEHVASQARTPYGQGRYRAFSDSSAEARDAVRSPAAAEARPFRSIR